MASDLKEVVDEVARAANALGIDVVLVGALMAEFTPEIKADFPTFRRTNDADFAVHVRDWADYQKLRKALTAKGYEPDKKVEHRLNRGAAMVDLVPYGTGVAPAGKLIWPESGFEMNVTGFEEACAEARKAPPQAALPAPVVTVPGFVLLKVLAYLDRKGRGEPKHKDDAKDIEYWLQNYASAADDGRRFGLAESGLPHPDYETAGAVLLGMEVGLLASVDAAAQVDRFLSESDDRYSPFMDALAANPSAEGGEKKRDQGLALLAAFRKGFLHGRGQKK